MQKWEYRELIYALDKDTMTWQPSNFGEVINAMGDEGWELVTCMRNGDFSQSFFLKRPKG